MKKTEMSSWEAKRPILFLIECTAGFIRLEKSHYIQIFSENEDVISKDDQLSLPLSFQSSSSSKFKSFFGSLAPLCHGEIGAEDFFEEGARVRQESVERNSPPPPLL